MYIIRQIFCVKLFCAGSKSIYVVPVLFVGVCGHTVHYQILKCFRIDFSVSFYNKFLNPVVPVGLLIYYSILLTLRARFKVGD